jgi:hypothetical protein
LFRLVQCDRRISAHAGAIRIGEQLARIVKILCLDRNQLGIAVQAGCLDFAALCVLEIAAFKRTNRIAEFALRLAPDVRAAFERTVSILRPRSSASSAALYSLMPRSKLRGARYEAFAASAAALAASASLKNVFLSSS